MWCYSRMLKIKWIDRVIKEKVLRRGVQECQEKTTIHHRLQKKVEICRTYIQMIKWEEVQEHY